MATKIQMRRGVESLWSKVDPILSDGEIAFIRDKNYIKVGDGEKTFNQLDKISGGSELIRVAQTSGDIELADNTQFVYSTVCFPHLGLYTFNANKVDALFNTLLNVLKMAPIMAAAKNPNKGFGNTVFTSAEYTESALAMPSPKI